MHAGVPSMYAGMSVLGAGPPGRAGVPSTRVGISVTTFFDPEVIKSSLYAHGDKRFGVGHRVFL